MFKTLLSTTCTALLLLTLGGCGTKGPLTLPPPPSSKAPASPAVATKAATQAGGDATTALPAPAPGSR